LPDGLTKWCIVKFLGYGLAATLAAPSVAAFAQGQGGEYLGWLLSFDRQWSPALSGRLLGLVSGHTLSWLAAAVIAAPSATACLARLSRPGQRLSEVYEPAWDAETTLAAGVFCLLPPSPLPFESPQISLLLGAPWLACCVLFQCVRLFALEPSAKQGLLGRIAKPLRWATLTSLLGGLLLVRLAAVARIEHLSVIERAARAFE
jgi:hypothetical protein